MEQEEYYDSLDGDLCSSSNSSVDLAESCETVKESKPQSSDSQSEINFLVIKAPPEKLPISRNSDSSLCSEFEANCSICYDEPPLASEQEHEIDISTIVPLYLGEKNLCEIGKTRRCRSTSTTLNNKNKQPTYSQEIRNESDATKNRKRRTRNTNLKIGSKQIEQAHSKSYLKIFQNRIRYPANNTNLTDTSRSMCGDTKRTSLSSNSTDEFHDAEENDFETASYYFKAISEAEDVPKSEYLSGNSASTVNNSFEMASVSEIFGKPETAKNRKPLRRYPYTKLHYIPVLGGLGPDTIRNQDKRELRKKQLSYGQKASYKNRIKLHEINILKNLKSEVNESISLSNKSKTV